VFLIIVLSVWAVLHGFVFWRLASVPLIATNLSRRSLVLLAMAFWASYPLARIFSFWHWDLVGRPLEFAAATWVGLLFLAFLALLVVDAVTVGGLLLPRWAPVLRGWTMVVAGVLAVIGLVQGLRPPVVRDYEVSLPGLPRERDGLLLVELSDIHLGTLIGRRWMAGLVTRVNAMRPDLVLVVGDLVDGNVSQVESLLPVLKTLRAPLGVWAVTGNHEFYAGLDRSIRLFEEAGYSVLRDRWAVVVPGLVLAGVDDLGARRQFGLPDRAIEKALANRPPGATILLSHSPWQANTAAAAGARLMLSGHTHGGQIWPFDYLVQLSYPLLAGRYQVGGMPVIVGRGAGTRGPRMRLWHPGEIVRVRLRTAA
jgi:predicted MPP superfamily phosphohydrolase